MRVLILVAGRGTRISRYLAGKPKCTVDIGGITLIRYTVEEMLKQGIKKIGIVLGYQAEEIKKVLHGLEVEYYYNPFFDVTNSIASVWFAKEFLNANEELLIMNGDVFLEKELLTKIINCNKSPVMFADSSRKEEADYKFKYEGGRLLKYGKELKGDDISGEYIGIGKFSPQFIPVLQRQMEKMINAQKHGVWWENIIYELSEKSFVFVEEIMGLFWAEVDYIEDYERILKHRGFEAQINLSINKI